MEDPGGVEGVDGPGTATGPEVCGGAREMTVQGGFRRTKNPEDARVMTVHSGAKGARSHGGVEGTRQSRRVKTLEFPFRRAQLNWLARRPRVRKGTGQNQHRRQSQGTGQDK